MKIPALIKRTSHPNAVGAEVEKVAGCWAMAARYHGAPRKLSDDYALSEQVLGCGMSGGVRLATSVNNPGKRFAVKSFKFKDLKPSRLASLKSEVEVYLMMDHPHVARLVNVYETTERLSLVMECMEGGELFSRLHDQQRFSELDASSATAQMLLAVNYLHSHEIIHRDLKLENFLYDSTKDDGHLKLIDFGFSKFMERNERLHDSCGTLAYLAPEVLRHNYTSQADMWSMGVIVFALVSGYMPFSGEYEDLYEKVKSGRAKVRPARWDGVSLQCKDFVNKLMQKRPEHRMTARKALAHPWISPCLLPKQNVQFPPLEKLKAPNKASLLRRCFLRAISWLLDDSAIEEVRDLFLAVDQDMGGTITFTELRNYIAVNNPDCQAGLNEIYSSLDLNHDDEIGFSEFLAAMMDTQVVQPSDGALKATFRNFDTDLSGYITPQNLQSMFGKSFSENTVRTMLDDADIVKDGRITYHDFASFVMGGVCPATDNGIVKKVSYQPNSVSVVSMDGATGPTAPCCTLM